MYRKDNISTFEFTRIGFLDWDMALPVSQNIDVRIDCRPQMNIAVDIRAGWEMDVQRPDGQTVLDDPTGKLVWWFNTVDPETGDYPDDLMAGFLPPFNPETGYELGWVEFRVKAWDDLPTGTRIENQAFVQFDFLPNPKTGKEWGPAPPDGPWINTIDAGKPTSSMNPLPAQSSPHLTLTWQGQDDEGGSGVVAYDIYLSKDGQPYSLWKTVEGTSTHFVGIPGSVYQFYSIARDGVGHFEEKEPVAEAQTRIYLAGDLTKDDVVNIEDLVYLASCWLSDCPEIDIAPAYYPDGIIDLLDLAELSNDWLKAVIE